MLIRGNAYVFVHRDGNGQVKALWPVPPTDVTVLRTPEGSLAYRLNHDGKETWLPVEKGYIATDVEILHYRWFGTGPEGLSPIGVARQQVGISVAATSYIGGFFERDATPETVLTTSGNLSDKQWERLVAQMEDRHKGFENSHQIAVFEGGAKLERVSLSPADAQFLAIYKLTEGKIASMYGVPPHKIGDLDRATFSNIEHLGIEFVQDALLPPISRLEHVTQRLFDDPEVRLKFDPNGRMRGDTAARTASYAAGRQWGYFSANDIRAMEDEAPIENGDVYLEPVNMVPAGSSPVQRDGQPDLHVVQMQPTEFRALPPAPRRRSASEEKPGWVARIDRALVEFVQQQQEAGAVEEERETWDELLAEQLAPIVRDIVADFGEREAEAHGSVFSSTQVEKWSAAAARSHAGGFNSLTFRDMAAESDEFEAALARAAEAARTIVDIAASFGRFDGARQAGAVEKQWITDDEEHESMHAARRASIRARCGRGISPPQTRSRDAPVTSSTSTRRRDEDLRAAHVPAVRHSDPRGGQRRAAASLPRPSGRVRPALRRPRGMAGSDQAGRRDPHARGHARRALPDQPRREPAPRTHHVRHAAPRRGLGGGARRRRHGRRVLRARRGGIARAGRLHTDVLRILGHRRRVVGLPPRGA